MVPIKPESIAAKIAGALAWRLHKVLGDRVVYGTLISVARRWRRVLTKPVFVAIAGSVGKSTAKELTMGMLKTKAATVGTGGSFNNIEEIAKALLQIRPWHGFSVTELSESRVGWIAKETELLRPTIGVVTVIGNDHLSAYGSKEAIAAQILNLVLAIPPHGTAILNADDPLVLAMATQCKGKVITYGTSSKAQLRAEDIGSVWPDRFQLTLVFGDERSQLVTQMCGAHWVPSVLGSIGVGLAVGMSLEEAAAGISAIAPFEGRMQPVETPNGVTFIRDDYKAPLWTLDACLEFLRFARTKRKILVIGEISDVGSEKAKKYVRIARAAQEVADIVVFVGPWASSTLRAQIPGKEYALRAFNHVREAAEFINSNTQPGDLVLLKGTNSQDHLLRVILNLNGSIACWRENCNKNLYCNECSERMRPSAAPSARLHKTSNPLTVPPQIVEKLKSKEGEQFIVGLGNPWEKYQGTPHNIGYETVDKMAVELALAWMRHGDSLIARGHVRGKRICLVKIQLSINRSGEGLKQLSDDFSFSPEQCMLIYDDFALPLGLVRTKMRGGAGGHQGVASIIESFQNDSFRRVKIGVHPEGTGALNAEYLVAPFEAQSRQAVESAISEAQDRAIKLAFPPIKVP